MNPSVWTAIKPIAAQATRDFLRTVGTALAAHGYITNGAGTEAFIGAGMTLAGLFWGWFTTSGYLQLAGLLKKLTATHTQAAAVEVAKVMPAAAQTGAADQAKAVVTAAGVAKVLLVAFALSFLVAGGSAHAQTGNIIKDIATARAKTVAPRAAVAAPTATPAASGLQKFMNDLASLQKKVVDDTVADLAAADVDAATLTNASDPTSFRDPIAHACYPAATKFLQSLPAASPTTGTLVAVQLFQKQRDFVAQIQAGLPVYLKLGCAPLLGDEATTLTKVLGLVGVTVAANTLLPGISAIMPVLP